MEPGGSIAIELAVSILSLKHRYYTAYGERRRGFEDYSPNIRSKSESHQITSVLCNSFFGGTNASILIK